MSIDLSQFLPIFISESHDHLQLFEQGLFELSNGSYSEETINSMFRAAHSIKGGAGMYKLDRLVEFAHNAETVLDMLRQDQIALSEPLIELFFQAKDVLGALLEALEANQEPAEGIEKATLQALSEIIHSDSSHPEMPSAENSNAQLASETIQAPSLLMIQIQRQAFESGLRFENIIRELDDLCTIDAVHVAYMGPAIKDMRPTECYCSVEIELAARPNDDVLEDIFAFAAGIHYTLKPVKGHYLSIQGETLALEQGAKLEPLLRELNETAGVSEIEVNYLGPEFWRFNPTQFYSTLHVSLEAATAAEVEDVFSFSAGLDYRFKVFDTPSQSISSMANEPELPQGLIEEQPAKTSTVSSGQSKLLKVRADKLDRLVDQVGDMLLQKAQLARYLYKAGDEEAQALLESFDRSLNQIRDASLALRLVPLNELFMRCQRTVREAAKATGKSISLEIHGGDTELDRLTVDKLSDPLTHILRNSCDHGIETPEERAVTDKPSQGRVLLKATYQDGQVIIEIRDDGKGINKEVILQKALDKALIEPDEPLNDAQIYQLIFHPGFSTAAAVTDLSGRGVGMDVVKRNINDLGGDVEVDSNLGEGTSVCLKLPLTSAIIEGFCVKVAQQTLVVSLDHVLECIPQDQVRLGRIEGQACMHLRGQYIPTLDLAQILGFADQSHQEQEAILVQTKQGRVALLVDKLEGELDSVIKPMGPILEQFSMFTGMLTLASGELAFLLNLNALADMAKKSDGSFANFRS